MSLKDIACIEKIVNIPKTLVGYCTVLVLVMGYYKPRQGTKCCTPNLENDLRKCNRV